MSELVSFHTFLTEAGGAGNSTLTQIKDQVKKKSRKVVINFPNDTKTISLNDAKDVVELFDSIEKKNVNKFTKEISTPKGLDEIIAFAEIFLKGSK